MLGDSGQPCLTPLLSWKKLLAQPFLRMQLSVLQVKKPLSTLSTMGQN